MKKKVFLVGFGLVISLLSLNNCSRPIKYPSTIELIHSPKSNYSRGEAIDFSLARVRLTLSVDNVLEYSASSSEVAIENVSTEEVGTFNASIYLVNFPDYIYTFKYSVVENFVTLDFNGGTYDGESTLKVPLYNLVCNLNEIIPTYSLPDYEFSGFYYDKECKNRATSLRSTIFSSDKDVTLYAGYDNPSFYNIFEYEIDSTDSFVTITGINSENVFDLMMLDEIVIPSYIKGYPVKEIGPRIFGQGTDFDFSSYLICTKISFLEDSSVEKIGDYAFANINSVNEIHLPTSLKIIGEGAFSGNNLSGTLNIPKNVEKIGASAFSYNSTYLEKVFIPSNSSLVLIDENAFMHCSNLREITLNEKLQEIRANAFYGCSILSSIDIPKNVFYIGIDAFYGCFSLDGINVDKENSFYTSINGNLYDKECTRLYRYNYNPNVDTFETLSSLKIIDNSAFSTDLAHNYLKSLVINDGVTTIGSSAFSGCNFDLKLPSTLSSFTPQAFNGYLGDSISIDPKSDVFVSENSIIYSKDYSTLYYVPQNFKDRIFTLKDEVKIINQYGIYKLDNVVEFHINSSSKLEKVLQYGLCFPFFSSLKMVEINKKEPFEVLETSLVSTKNSLNSYFSIYFEDFETLEAYKNKWDGYTTISDEFDFDLKDLMFDGCSQLINTLTLLSTDYGFTPYSVFERSRISVERKEITNFNNYDIFLILNNLDYIYKKNMASDALLDYFMEVEFVFYNDLLSVITNVKNSTNTCITCFQKMIKRYEKLPVAIKTRLSSVYQALTSNDKCTLAFTKNDYINQEIINFETDKNSFDNEKYENLYKEIEETSFLSSVIETCVFEKWILIYTNKLAYDFINADLSTHASYNNALKIYYGDSNEYGLFWYLDNWHKTEYKRSLIYKYDKVVEKQAELEEHLYTELDKYTDEINSFDIENYDYDRYLGFFNSILSYYFEAGMQYFDSVLSQKAFYIYCSLIVDEALIEYQIVNEENCVEVYFELSGIRDFISINLSIFPHNFEKFSDKFEETSNLFDVFIKTLNEDIANFEINETNLSTKFLSIETRVARLGDNAYFYLSNSINGVQVFYKYQTLKISYLIMNLLNEADELCDNNYIEIRNSIYGYFDRTKFIKIYGIEELINENSFNINAKDIYNYEKYLNLKDDFDSYLGNGRF